LSEEFTHTIVAHQYRVWPHEYEERYIQHGVLEETSVSDDNDVVYDGEWRDDGERMMRSFIVGYLTEEQADLIRKWKVIY